MDRSGPHHLCSTTLLRRAGKYGVTILSFYPFAVLSFYNVFLEVMTF